MTQARYDETLNLAQVSEASAEGLEKESGKNLVSMLASLECW